MSERVDEYRRALTIKQLPSGYVHLRSLGPCNWAQPPHWPCSEEVLREHAFGEACEDFIQACLQSAHRQKERPRG